MVVGRVVTVKEGATGGAGGRRSGVTDVPARIVTALRRIVPDGRLAVHEPMSLHTSFRIGGPADCLVTVGGLAELTAVLSLCRQSGVACLILGRGTNLLVRDGGIRGVVVSLAGELAWVNIDADAATVTAGAGASLGEVVRACGEKGLSGLEFAVGIPGTVGGAVFMNAGAYGSEIGNVVRTVVVLRPGDLVTETLPVEDLGFGYRASRPQREGLIVLSACFGLQRDDPVTIRAREGDFEVRRRLKQPSLPSAGSIFKRPEGHFAGALIDLAGCRGRRVGDAQVSEVHAGFIVNLGKATARDVLALIDEVGEAVEAGSGIRLKTEIKIVGEDFAGSGPGDGTGGASSKG
jgi:UDP-N-acetylmuramate dehydrogenase